MKGTWRTKTLGTGCAGGLLGGALMIAWLMIVFAWAGPGAWAPVNYMAHTTGHLAALDGAFRLAAAAVGLAVHFAVSVVVGILFAFAIRLVPLARDNLVSGVLAGLAYAVAVWAVDQFGIWRSIDAAAADAMSKGTFAIGHLLYGLLLGWTLVMLSARRAGSHGDTADEVQPRGRLTGMPLGAGQGRHRS